MTRASTFKEIVELYESITPIRGERASADIRPIEERRYSFRRIKKYDENCYALLDGDYSAHRTSEQYEKDTAPFLWTRDPETGDEFVRIRNGVGDYAHTGRYEFLHNHMPIGMRFVIDNGRHYVRARVGTGDAPALLTSFVNEDFPLPKSTYTWDWTAQKPYGADDGVYLTFKALGGGMFQRVGKLLETKGTRVDKDLKKQWKDKIDEFYLYMAAIVPMMDTSWGGVRDYRENIESWMKVHYSEVIPGRTYGYLSLFGIPHGLARLIVTQQDHELRPALVALIAQEIGAKREVNDIDTVRDIRGKYNRVMNKLLNMYEVKKG